MAAEPAVLNMVVCDAAHRDPGTGKWSLLGLFNSISAPSFPVVHPNMITYVAIANVAGKMPLRFQIVAADRKDEVLYKGDAELSVTGSAPVVDMAITARNVTFTRAGQYLLQLFTQDHFLAERPIAVGKS